MDAVITWESFDIKNWDQSFLTATNGLNLVKRQVKSRNPTDFSTVNLSDAIYNYYPVTSAISIIDERAKLQMTVLNDRSQGGSVVQEGRIELMQNRRLFYDDDRGVDEVLNETDQYGNGISVPARYKLVFTELKT